MYFISPKLDTLLGLDIRVYWLGPGEKDLAFRVKGLEKVLRGLEKSLEGGGGLEKSGKT